MSEKPIFVTKRDGSKELLDIEKIHRVLFWATEDIKNKSEFYVSQIEVGAKLLLEDGIQTKDIHRTLIKTAAQLISIEYPEYQYIASKLELFDLRKKVWGDIDPPTLYDHIVKRIEDGFYDKKIITYFTKEEFQIIDTFINHENDYQLAYAGIRQFIEKYIVQDRTTRKMIETPQFVYIVAAIVMVGEMKHLKTKEDRIRKVNQLYQDFSSFMISLPSPIMGGLRTPLRQYSSCVTVAPADDLESLGGSNVITMLYGAARAGLGVDYTRIRAMDQPIRGGQVKHTGLIPFLQALQKSLNSCSQGGMRKASATVNLLSWHLDFEDLIQLKNNKGTEDNRERHLDYCFHINKYLMSRYLNYINGKGKDYITLFSPEEVPELYDAFYSKDVDLFGRVYEQCEDNPNLTKRTISARDWIYQIIIERQQTGRIYLFFADNVNKQGLFTKPVRQTNLCVEITLPTEPVFSPKDNGREYFILECGSEEEVLSVIKMNDDDKLKLIQQLKAEG